MKLSIVTICLNAEAYIEKTMNSILNQTVSVYEYIIIDGKSSDNTNFIVKRKKNEFEKKNIRFVHISERDEGISDAFNKGIRIATGDVIGLINAGDELMLDTNYLLHKYYNEHDDVWYGNCLWIDNNNNIEYERKAKKNKLGAIRYEMVLIHPSTFVKKSAYKKYGLFNTNYKYCMDEELLCRFYENGASFFYIDSKLSKFLAGGVSDKSILMTLKEGLKLALDTNHPNYVRTYYSYFIKLFRYRFSTWLKKRDVFKMVKKNVRKIN